MNIQIRRITDSDKKAVQKLGQRAFTGLERFFISKPKEGLVITADDKIAGAGVTKIIGGKDTEKTGDFDLAFIDRSYHGRGLGNKLYQAVTEYFRSEGCTCISAQVKDDNPGSWHLLEKKGYCRVSLPEALRLLGLKNFLLQLLHTPALYAYGMDLYLASLKPDTPVPEKKNGYRQFLLYVLTNLIILSLSLISNPQHRTPWLFAAYGFLLAVPPLVSRLYLLTSKRRWQFRMTNCGVLVSAIVAFIGSPLPMIGNWYPVKYEKSTSFDREMGITAALEWSVLLAAFLIAALAAGRHPFAGRLNYIAYVLLIFRLIPIYPFESLGGRRVWQWNKAAFLVFAVLTVGALWIFG